MEDGTTYLALGCPMGPKLSSVREQLLLVVRNNKLNCILKELDLGELIMIDDKINMTRVSAQGTTS